MLYTIVLTMQQFEMMHVCKLIAYIYLYATKMFKGISPEKNQSTAHHSYESLSVATRKFI